LYGRTAVRPDGAVDSSLAGGFSKSFGAKNWQARRWIPGKGPLKK